MQENNRRILYQWHFHAMSKSSKPIPIAIPNELLAQIDRVAGLTNKTRAEVMRLAMEVGLEDLKRCNYGVAGAIVDSAKGSASNVRYAISSNLHRATPKSLKTRHSSFA